MADGVGPEITVRPLTAELWDDAITVFGTRGDPASCWCQFFIQSSQDWHSSTRESNRERLRAQCDQAVPPGLVGYRDGEAAGWVAVAPRVAYPRILRSRTLEPVLGAESLDDSRIWSVTCFVVRVGFRRQGVAAALLEAAVGFAAAHGAAAVEGYPVDVGERVDSRERALPRRGLDLRVLRVRGGRPVLRPAPRHAAPGLSAAGHARRWAGRGIRPAHRRVATSDCWVSPP